MEGIPLKLARIVLLSLLLLSAPVARAAPKGGATAENGLIVYSVWEDVDGHPEILGFHIYTVDPQGGEPIRLTQALDSETNPRWSPDGTQILFLRQTYSFDPDTGDLVGGGPNHLFVMQADGSDPRQLTSGQRSVYEAEWSPDGQRIAFTRAYRPGASKSDLYVIDADGSDLRRLTNNKNWNQGAGVRNSLVRPSWSPSGHKIAFLPGRGTLRGLGVYTVHSDGSKKPKKVLSDFHVYDVDWSPIDGRLGLAVIGSCARNASLNEGGLGILNLRTGKTARIAKDASAVEWSPNGLRLTYEQYDCGSGQFYKIRVVRASGKQDHAVPTYPEPGDWYSTTPHWSRDGNEIAFLIAELEVECSGELRVGASSGGSDEVVVQLECGEYFSDLDW